MVKKAGTGLFLINAFSNRRIKYIYKHAFLDFLFNLMG